MLLFRGRQISEGGESVQKGEFDGTGRTVALFADDDFGDAFVGVVLLLIINFVAVDEGDYVRVLFDGAGLA
jgi:hypothetical protein